MSCLQSSEQSNIWLLSYRAGLTSKWKPVSLTHVEYPEDDIVGKLMAWLSLIPIFILVAFVTLIIFRRELHTITFFLGIITNEVLNYLLKYTFKHPRPCRELAGVEERVTHGKYGMPSSHSQFMGFFACYMIFFSYIRLQGQVYERYRDNIISSIRQHFIAFTSITTSILVAYSRIYLHYHTQNQVLIGFTIGSVCGLGWFVLTQLVFTPFFPIFTNTKLAEILLIKDSTNIPDILWFEYTSSRMEARQRSRRSSQKTQ